MPREDKRTSARPFMRLPLTLTIGVVAAACGGPKAPSKPGGSLPPEVIQREVRSHYGAFRRSYESGLAHNPQLQGRVVVRFVVELDGLVRRVVSNGSDMPDPKVVECIVAEYKNLTFPHPEGGIVTVVYPIMFSPGDDAADPDRQTSGSPR
jgi:hypothetical protein